MTAWGRNPETEAAPEGRVAAIADALVRRMMATNKRPPDFADFRDALRTPMAREILRARIAEAKSCGDHRRVAELERALSALFVPLL